MTRLPINNLIWPETYKLFIELILTLKNLYLKKYQTLSDGWFYAHEHVQTYVCVTFFNSSSKYWHLVDLVDLFADSLYKCDASCKLSAAETIKLVTTSLEQTLCLPPIDKH